MWPFKNYRPTKADCIVVAMIGVILWGLAQPSVTTNCTGRRQSAPPPPVDLSEDQSAGIPLVPSERNERDE